MWMLNLWDLLIQLMRTCVVFRNTPKEITRRLCSACVEETTEDLWSSCLCVEETAEDLWSSSGLAFKSSQLRGDRLATRGQQRFITKELH